MPKPVHLPDAMPEIVTPALLVVCDAHTCRFIKAGGRTLLEDAPEKAPEIVHTDRKSQMRGPSGVMSGVGDDNQAEESRLRQFANTVVAQIAAELQKGVGEFYLAAPSKVLSILKDHLSKAISPKLRVVLDGMYIKESPLDILLRFRPDLSERAAELRDEENFSAKKHLPK